MDNWEINEKNKEDMQGISIYICGKIMCTCMRENTSLLDVNVRLGFHSSLELKKSHAGCGVYVCGCM